MKTILLFMLVFLTTACSGGKDAASNIAAFCLAQKIGSPFRTPDPMPRSLELWKPRGDQVSIGVRRGIFEELRGRKKLAICTLTIGPDELVTDIETLAGP